MLLEGKQNSPLGAQRYVPKGGGKKTNSLFGLLNYRAIRSLVLYLIVYLLIFPTAEAVHGDTIVQNLFLSCALPLARQ